METTGFSSAVRVLSELPARNPFTRQPPSGLLKGARGPQSVADTANEKEEEKHTRRWNEHELKLVLARVDALPPDAWTGFLSSVDYEAGDGDCEAPPQNSSAIWSFGAAATNVLITRTTRALERQAV